MRKTRKPTESKHALLEHVAPVTTDETNERDNDAAARQRREERFRQIVESIPGLVIVLTATGEIEFVNRRCVEYFGKTVEDLRTWTTQGAVHPDDLSLVVQAWQRAVDMEQPCTVEARLRRADDVYHWFLARVLPAKDAAGRRLGWYAFLTDIDDLPGAEQRAQASEGRYRRIIDAIPHLISALSPDGRVLYANRTVLEYSGLQPEDLAAPDLRTRLFHPEDLDRVMDERQRGLERGRPFTLELRTRHHADGYRWCMIQYKPVHDEHGQTIQWYATGTDIHERKRAEDQVKNENLALREEVSRASMFEEIVGTAPSLRTVLSRVAKVAPSDSSVLITGETGTGKELVARAIHNRSRRASLAFVSVNCAAIPRDLIASELFGHEKGAFTGATQRRLGRFELADGGTIFLDEVGELPSETQVALLRVLQEYEFERLGGSGPIHANVRVIAATNRDLEAAIAAGHFRSDLFYRLNVFPIEMPSLRARREDIPLLVEYFLDRYARKAGKSFRAVEKETLNRLRSYRWPGNIRELQNVIERSVLLCEGETFTVDESWLARRPLQSRPDDLELSAKVAAQEKEIIETALSQSGGRVFGPSGAAAKLGIARSTLESKIRSLKIDKRRFKTRLR